MTKSNSWTRVPVCTLVALGFGLAACGGGGGDGGGGVAMLDLTVSNRDTVAHATTASLPAMDAWGVAIAPIMSTCCNVAQRETPMAVGAGLPVAWIPQLPQRVRDALNQAARGTFANSRERPQAVIIDPPYACGFGGTYTLTADDSDNNGVWSVGEVLAIDYNNCRWSASDVVNGRASITLMGIAETWIAMDVAMSQLSNNATNGRHGIALNGAINLDITTNQIIATARGPVTANIQTHHFSDTVTLQDGFVEASTFTSGHLLSTLRGTIESVAADGAAAMTTDTALGSLDADMYPHVGSLRVTGNRGVMRLSPQSATQVKIDLDHDDDGQDEVTDIVAWDELL